MGERTEGRVVYIDNLKGLAAFLVVLGHIVTYDKDFYRLYNFIYSFHMPLFMFLSGCTTSISYGRWTGTGRGYLCKRFMNIMVPYFVWAAVLPLLVTRPLNLQVWKDIFYKTFVTNRMFWFLPTLYGLVIVYVCYCLVKERILQRTKQSGTDCKRNFVIECVSCMIVVFVTVVLMLFTEYQLLRDMVGFVIPFFAAVMYTENEWVRRLCSHRLSVTAAFAIFLLLISSFDFGRASVITSLLRMLLGLCAIIILLRIFVKWKVPQVISSQLILWGRHSLLIYILHIQLLRKSGLLSVHFPHRTSTLLWYCFTSILVCYFGSLLAMILEHIPPLGMVFLGTKGKNRG